MSFHPAMESLSQEHGGAEELCSSMEETHLGLNPTSANQRMHKLTLVTSPMQNGESNSSLTGVRGALNKICWNFPGGPVANTLCSQFQGHGFDP